MTGTSLALQDDRALRGEADTLPGRASSVEPIRIPKAVKNALADGYAGEWSSVRALAEMLRDGVADKVPQLANSARSMLNPMDRQRLAMKLTTVGGAMAPNRSPVEVTLWLEHMTSGLRDIPEDLLLHAIDEWVRESKFLPSVAELRERAEPKMRRREKEVQRLDCLARLIASGTKVLPAPPKPPRQEDRSREGDRPMTPSEVDEMNGILASIGAATRYHPDGSRFEVAIDAETRRRVLGPPRKPTREDYINMFGVDPAVLDGTVTLESESEAQRAHRA